MVNCLHSKKISVTLCGLIVLAFAVGLTLSNYFGLSFTDFNLPLRDSYTNTDGRMTIAYFKMILSGEWSFFDVAASKFLSAPFEFRAYDFPMPMFSVWLYIKALGVLSTNSVIIFNLFYISTFFLNAFVMFIVLRKLRINLFLAIAIGYLFTFLPFHYFRLGHIFYTGYFFIPIWIYYLLLLQEKKPLLFKLNSKNAQYSFDLSKKNVMIIFTLLFSSTWNFYYTFFFSLLLLFTLVSSYLHHKNRYHIYSTVIVLLFLVAPFAINMLPYKIYEMQNGKNINIAQRNAIEAEIYGLKAVQLLLPVTGHRSEVMAQLKETYNQSTLLFNESRDATLGIVASLGFLILIVIGFFQNIFSTTLVRLAQLNFFTFLLSTVGGFGVVFAFIVTPQIRAYNRISVFIAALSLMALAIVLNRFFKENKYKNVYFFFLASLIGMFGIWDQTPFEAKLHPWKDSKNEFLSDRQFVENIQNIFDLKQEIQIAQFPYLYYPESSGAYHMKDYEQIYGYLHSNTIHWSYGSVKGREADAWNRELNKEPIEKQIRILEAAGFSGLVINRNGYPDGGKNIEDALVKLLNIHPLISDNRQLSFFKIHPNGNKVTMPPVFTGFYDWEGDDGVFRWASENANILWINNENITKEEKVYFEIGSLIPRTMTIKLNKIAIDNFAITPGVQNAHAYTLQLMPGRNIVEFVTPEPSIKPSAKDNRKLSFSVAKFKRITSN